jgi:phosphoribosylamine--glycine ligase
VGEAVQKCSGGDHNTIGRNCSAIPQLDTGDARVFDVELRDLGLQDAQIGLALEDLAHFDPILLLVALGAWRPDGRAPAGIQKTKLDSDRVGDFAHHAAERVHFADQMPLRDAADGRITRHLRDQIQVHRDHRGAQTQAGARTRSLTTGVSGADDHDVVRGSHNFQCGILTLQTKHMRILVIGGGGREHALCWKLAQSEKTSALYAAPGNPGIAQVAKCLATTDYLAAAESIDADLTVVGPEAPLAAGIVDQFRAKSRTIVGPTATAARLESSKAFAKELMMRAGIPTARFATAASLEEAHDALLEFDLPVVIKADGLAAGKGVIIAKTRDQAKKAIDQLMSLGGSLVIEEFLVGEEVSFIVLSDGVNVLALEPTQDHKTVFDSDQGPNTGGMGAYCDGRVLDALRQELVMAQVIRPAIGQMRAEGMPFTGFLYAGLMMTAEGPKVVEFNARLGDPETQALMHRLESDFVEPLYAAAQGALEETPLDWKADPSVCVVLAAEGYPGSVRTGDAITGIDQVRAAQVFQAGTKLEGERLVTAGGRVLGLTASGATLDLAIRNTYAEVQKIHFDGMHYRTDIGKKGLKRWA